jgi:hypothetical protein
VVDNLSVDEIKQLVNFYRQKLSDTEFQLLQTQLQLNRLIVANEIKQSAENNKTVEKKSK